MNFGQRGKDLLLDLKRSDWLPIYDDENVRGTLKEISLHYNELRSLTNAATAPREGVVGKSEGLPEEFKPALLLHQAALQRNKRCILAYHMYRMEKLKELRREGTTTVLSTHHRALLSESEIEFYNEYDKLISKQSLAVDLDLTAHLNPPEDDFVEVRVAQPGVGRITTEGGGTVSLDVGTTHHIRRGDVEHLIRRGVLHQLNTEENG